MNNVKMKRIDWILTLLIPILLLFIMWKTCGINFETVDDTWIMKLVTGATTGLPTAETVFCNILWGAVLSFLYGINEKTPWYIGIYLVLNWISLSILFLACIKVPMNHDNEQNYSKNSTLTYAFGVAIFFALFFSVFAYYSVVFQFTAVPALCGLGAIILFTLFPVGNRYSFILFAILLFCADTIRPQVGYMVTVAFALTAVALYLLHKQINKIYVSLTFIMQAVTYGANALYEKLNHWTAFRQYVWERVAWIDYAHPSFQENSAIYENVGWTESLYKIADRRFAMDRRLDLNAKTFESINKEIDAVSSFVLHISGAQIIMTFVVLAFLAGISIFICIYKHEYKRAITIGGGGVMTGVILLYFSGRLLYRVSFSVIVLFLLPVLFLTMRGLVGLQRKKYFIMAACIVVLVLMYSIFGNYGLIRRAYLIAMDPERKEAIQTKKEVEQYAINHPENIFISVSLTSLSDPFETYEDGKPYNFMGWGGSAAYSPPYYDQLAANGFEELYSDCFFDENVFFVGKEPDADLIMYMRDEFSENVSVETVYESTGFFLYRFNKGES